MNNKQKILLVIYLPLTVLILFLDNIYPGADIVQYIKYAIIVSLFLTASIIKKKYQVQKLINLALFFVVIADFFLVFSTTIHGLKIDLKPFGIAGFLPAYGCLIAAFQKNLKIGAAEILTAIPLAGISLYVYISLHTYFKGPMLIGAPAFGLVLFYLTWTAICTVFRKHFKPQTARLIAIFGLLIFASDVVNTYSMYDPAYAGSFIPWLNNIIWATYIPALTLLTVVISEEKL